MFEYYEFLSSPLGNFICIQRENKLCSLHFQPPNSNAILQKTPLIQEAQRQLNAYFSNKLFAFDLPLCLDSLTPFARKVCLALSQVPYGSTCSYKELAQILHSPQASCAVGNALKCNPLLVLIPCHRIVSSKDFGGYVLGENAKRFLLDLEAKAQGSIRGHFACTDMASS